MTPINIHPLNFFPDNSTPVNNSVSLELVDDLLIDLDSAPAKARQETPHAPSLSYRDSPVQLLANLSDLDDHSNDNNLFHSARKVSGASKKLFSTSLSSFSSPVPANSNHSLSIFESIRSTPTPIETPSNKDASTEEESPVDEKKFQSPPKKQRTLFYDNSFRNSSDSFRSDDCHLAEQLCESPIPMIDSPKQQNEESYRNISMRCPDRPQPKTRAIQSRLSSSFFLEAKEPPNPYVQAQNLILNAPTMFTKGTTYTLQLPTETLQIKYIGAGSYKDVFTDLGKKNVYKFYRKDTNAERAKYYASYTECTLQQCQQVQKLKLNCTPVEDIGGILKSPYIAQSLLDKYPFLRNARFSQAESDKLAPIVNQIVHFYATAYRNDLALDLPLENLRINQDDDTIYLIDFREEDQSDMGVECCLRSNLNSASLKNAPAFRALIINGINTELGNPIFSLADCNSDFWT